MADDQIIDAEYARTAKEGLVAAITFLLEAAIDNCASADVMHQTQRITDLCRDATRFGEAIVALQRWSRP